MVAQEGQKLYKLFYPVVQLQSIIHSALTLTLRFLLVWASTTQMARLIVITVDNGCGSPLTSATTGSAHTYTHTHTKTMHIPAEPDFINQWKPGRIIFPGRGVKQPTEV